MTPDQFKTLFDGNSIVIMFIVGLLVKYVPQLAKVSNQAIGWLNVFGYILTRLFVPTAAHAAGLGDVARAVPDIGSILIGSLTSAAWARTLYETLGRPFLERVLKLKKAVPAA